MVALSHHNLPGGASVNVDNDQVLTNIVGAIAESARTHENRELIREQEGLAPIIRLIASTSPGTSPQLQQKMILMG